MTKVREFRYKQVIAVRKDLKMSCGKVAAQVAHASLIASENCKRSKPEWWRTWWSEGQKKVVLAVSTEEELIEVYEKACSLNLPCSLVADMGLTEVPPGTKTAVAIGPAPEEFVDKVTGKLKLYK
ncbi:MAG: peptidyl-tRNA hydrolase [Thermoprotei archaeon]|nr:MAG: peptidyl-tRNA hydrolase [Thermoprotei archaeon]